MTLHQLPEDINIEQLMSYLPKGQYKIAFRGIHRRNTYNDIADIEYCTDCNIQIGVVRNSIYNSLPEFLFHPVDRFSNLPRLEEKERFAEEVEKQAFEKENAFRFFSPVDLQLLVYKEMIQEELYPVIKENSVLSNILGDRLTNEQRNNRFIRKAIPFLPSCKFIRGNRTLLTMLLRKVFIDEEITIHPAISNKEFRDDYPRYTESLGETLNSTFLGNIYDDTVTTYNVVYWPEVVDASFLTLVDEIEQFRLFVQDYFLSIEELLHFNISHDVPVLYAADDQMFNYLNYNTNL